MKKQDVRVKADLLRQHYLFSELDEKQLGEVVETAYMNTLVKGEQLFAQGENANHFFLLRDGQLKLSRLSPDGDEKVIEIIQPNQTFAEAMAFQGEGARYPVYAHAVEPSEVIAFCNKTFTGVLRSSVDTCFKVMNIMSRRLHGCINEIDNLTLRNATYRMVVFLLQQLPDDAKRMNQVRLPATKHLIASRLSIKPETLSRILARLSQMALIGVQGNDIVINDVAALRTLLQESA